MRAFTFMLTFLLVLSISAGLCSAFDLPDEYNSKVTAIDFFPSGAKFTFSVETDSEGNFQGFIPGAFAADSIRLLYPEDIDGDINIVQYSRTRWTPSQLEALKTQVDDQNKLIDDLNTKRAALEQTLEFLDELKPEKSNPEALLKYIKDSQALRLDTENELAEIKLQISQEQEKARFLTTELNNRRPRGDNAYIAISGKASDTVEFTAFTTAAYWGPKYILNLNSNTGEISVNMYVRASQKTGLDFEGDMTFHTKTPDERITTPYVNPLRVAIKPKEEKIATLGNVSYSRNNKMLAKSEMALEDAMPMPFEEADNSAGYEAPVSQARKTPVMTESLSDRTIELEGVITGDGIEKELNANIDALYLKSTPIITLIPEQRNDAWIVASMDKGNKTLIPGQAELRVDGYTSGKIMLGEYGESQRNIPFGYAEAITVKKEALIEKTGVSWFSGVFTSGYKLEVTNGTSMERVITVKDRLPIPTDEKIKLDVKRIEPKETERDKENRLTWEVTVPAGGTVPIIVDYTLSYPSGEELQYR